MVLHLRFFPTVVAEDLNLFFFFPSNDSVIYNLMILNSLLGWAWGVRLTILFWYGSGIGVAAISTSNFSHTFDMSQTDFEQSGHAYLQSTVYSVVSWKTATNNNPELFNILTGNVLSFPPNTSDGWCVRRAKLLHRSLIQTGTTRKPVLPFCLEGCSISGRKIERKDTSKQMGQSWCIAPSTQGWLFLRRIE